MLQPNRLSHEQLGISFKEYSALITVMHKLERGELKHYKRGTIRGDNFNMSIGYDFSDCGTLGCIGGWVAMIMNLSMPGSYVLGKRSRNPLTELYFPRGIHPLTWKDITPAQAAQAIGNFLRGESDCWAA